MAQFTAIDTLFWRMLSVRWQLDPLGSGSHRTGGRWNPPGVQALYLAREHATAIAEYHQDLIRPGTLAAYRVRSARIVDLTDPVLLVEEGIDPAALSAPWRTIFRIDGGVPPGWPIAERLIAADADGALVPSIQQRGGVNLVLWRWHDAVQHGEGAAVICQDPMGDLARH